MYDKGTLQGQLPILPFGCQRAPSLRVAHVPSDCFLAREEFNRTSLVRCRCETRHMENTLDMLLSVRDWSWLMQSIADAEFLDLVNSQNEMLLVMRLHQLMDRLLSSLIEERLIESHHLEVRRIPFAVRVELAEAMGLVERSNRGALFQFNSLRNRFAHDSKTAVVERDALDLFNGRGEKLGSMIGNGYGSYSGPIECVREIGTCLVIILDKALEHERDAKLWDTAMIQEAREVLGERRRDTGAVNARIRARFECLKEEKGSQDSPTPSPVAL
jgi:hypothetical protein